jgi:hypothetical protein
MKHQFAKIGNVIESNIYHSLELNKKRKNLKLSFFNISDIIVFWFHFIFSNHSRSWYVSLFWIVVTGSLTAYSLNTELYDSLGCINSYIFLEDTFQNMSIINLNEEIKKTPIIFLLNKVSLGYLYYQFLTAIRKDTRK